MPPIPFPAQPADRPWPGAEWPTARLPRDADAARLEKALDGAFTDGSPLGATHAVAVVHRGALVAERYAAGVGPETPLPSWSMAKSVLHAAVGLLVREGRFDVAAPIELRQWSAPSDPRSRITGEHLLRMTSGLRFDAGQDELIELPSFQMLFGEGRHDTAAFAAGFPLDHEPGHHWSYSSGSSNILSAAIGRRVGGGEGGMRAFLDDELFGPLGMRHAEPKFDAAGTWVASSFLTASARDFARFGLLYLRGGFWKGRALLPPGWADAARTLTPQSGGEYGAHFWLALDGSGRFSANGFLGQYTLIDPARDLVVVRLGQSAPDQKRALVLFLAEIVGCFARS